MSGSWMSGGDNGKYDNKRRKNSKKLLINEKRETNIKIENILHIT